MAFSFALELTALLAFWLALGAWQHDRDAPARLPFVGMAMAVVLWCAGEIMAERGAVSLWTGSRIKYVGIMALPPLWLGVAAHAVRLQIARRLPYFPLGLMLPEALIYGLLFLGPWGALFLQPDGAGPAIRGPLWWVHAGYAYLLTVLGATLFLTRALTQERDGRWRRFALGIASMIPLVGNAAYVASGLAWPHDPTPVLLGVTMIALRSAVMRGGLLEVLPVAQRDLIDHLPFGVVLADRDGAVIDLNPAAERRLGMRRAEVLGRALEAVLAFAPADTTAEITTVRVRGRDAARFALLDLPPQRGEVGLTPKSVAA